MRYHTEEMKMWAPEMDQNIIVFHYKELNLNPQNLCISRVQYHKFLCSQHFYREIKSTNKRILKIHKPSLEIQKKNNRGITSQKGGK